MISLCLTNCEKEPKEDLTSPPKSRYEVRTLTKQEFQTNVLVSKKLKNLGKKKKDGFPDDVQSREIYNADLGFTINTDFVVYVEDTETGSHSYSFPLTRDEPEDDQVENLLLQSDMEGGYDAYIVKYGFTAEDYLTLSEPTINQYETSFLSVDFDTSVFNPDELSRTSYECNETWNLVSTTEHNGNLHGANTDGSCPVRGCQFGTSRWVMSLSCDFYYDGVGAGGVGSPSGGGGGGSSSGGNNNTDPPHDDSGHDPNPILGSPAIVDEMAPQQFTDPNCNELHRLSTSAYTQAAFNNLKRSETLNRVDKKETGYVIRANPDFPYFSPPNMLAETQGRQITIPRNPLIFCVMHTHPVGSYEMFFHGDINTLYQQSQEIFDASSIVAANPNFVYDSSLFTVTMTVRNNTYAIKIDDPVKLANIETIYHNEKKLKKFNRDFEDSQSRVNHTPANASQNDLAIGFLKLVEQYDLGISLYRTSNNDIANNPNNGNNQTSNWKKLTLNASGTQIVPQDCN